MDPQQFRVADTVQIWPDPDPANQNFKNRIWICTYIYSHQTDYFRYYYIDFYLKKFKKLPENLKKITGRNKICRYVLEPYQPNCLYLQLYIFRVGSGRKDPAPTRFGSAPLVVSLSKSEIGKCVRVPYLVLKK